jgi:hypothetical protein
MAKTLQAVMKRCQTNRVSATEELTWQSPGHLMVLVVEAVDNGSAVEAGYQANDFQEQH